jgi:hypothetical protein
VDEAALLARAEAAARHVAAVAFPAAVLDHCWTVDQASSALKSV